jgi:hypothetical protein
VWERILYLHLLPVPLGCASSQLEGVHEPVASPLELDLLRSVVDLVPI